MIEKIAFIGIRCLPEERRALEAIAEQERLNLSEATRFVIRRIAEQRGLWPPEPIRTVQPIEAKPIAPCNIQPITLRKEEKTDELNATATAVAQ